MSFLLKDLTPLSALGAFVTAGIVYKVVDFIWLYARPSTLHKYLHATSGKPAWALVTGASDGIGKALALELASRGFNVVIHGRNATKLEGVRAELSKSHPALSFRTVVVDAFHCHVDPTTWLREVAKSLEDIHLTVIVNNAGGGTKPAFGTLEEYEPQTILDNVHLNAAFPTLLTAALIPVLVKNGPSLIINICSLSDIGLPLVSFYSGSKSFNHSLSVSISREMQVERRDIEVIAHRLGSVTQTQGSMETSPHLFGPSARVAAAAVLARTGCGKKTVIPCWSHGLQQIMLDVVPEWIADRIFASVIRDMRIQQDSKKID